MDILQLKTPTLVPFDRFVDNRGLLEALLESDVKTHLCIKRTLSNRGVIRGFHWQKDPKPQSKLIYVLKGEILDAAAKVEDGWPNPKTLFTATLTEGKPVGLFVPADYAHAYQTVSNDSIVLYVCFGLYDMHAEVAFNPLKLGVKWPVAEIVASRKDLEGKSR